MKPTESELKILNFLWQHGPSKVKEVHEHLSATKDAGYTTTLKLMQIMHEKKILGRNEEGRSHIYFALANEDATRQSLLNKLVDTAFRGSAASLVMQALGNHKATKAEIEEIRNLLNQIEKNR